MFQSIILTSGSCRNFATSEKVLTVKTCSLPITVAFDGGPNEPCSAGSVFNLSGDSITFANANATDVTLEFWLANDVMAFSPSDSSVSNAETYLLGNLGHANNSSDLWATDGVARGVNVSAAGWASLSTLYNYFVSGKDNGHRRQFVVFAVSSSSSSVLNVMDASLRTFLQVAPGQIVQLTTDSDIYVSGATGQCFCSIGQCFLTQ